MAIDFLRRRVARGPVPPAALARAVDRVLGTRGAVRIEALAREVGWSRRQLERRFACDVGLPPKTLARVVRVQALLACARREPRVDWAGLALDLGFADQSHLVRDLRELAGATPRGLLALDDELAGLFTSSARLAAYFSPA